MLAKVIRLSAVKFESKSWISLIVFGASDPLMSVPNKYLCESNLKNVRLIIHKNIKSFTVFLIQIFADNFTI